MKKGLHSFENFVAFARARFGRKRPLEQNVEEVWDGKYPPAPERRLRFDEEETYTSELCIRVFERVMDWIGEDEELGRSRYFDIFAAYQDILQDELKDYAFDLAYELYAEDKVVKERRRELSRRRND